ncbi:hypothetical protein [Solirubrum puertoriconensis]|uniref:Uncharacterized protein n=1 Tax=Solirubrum puertoriconensis TaxID=1751427 RepID=A0A9X0HNV6_SOLP1|nr:hypothetical protein [Solirubrum puertoriconensis]KUG09388.1 hypothetical protein ASU33_16805 [Solirubrum puertoriconensis]
MLTQQENQQAQTAQRAFIEQCATYRQLLEANELPLSVCVPTLKTAIRNKLFAQLLTVDAGLKMRFEMLRTEEAQEKLVAETINLDGYEVVEQIEKQVAAIKTAFSRIMISAGSGLMMPEREMPLSTFASEFGLNLAAYLDKHTFNWKGNEHVLAYFQKLGKELEMAREMIHSSRDSSASIYQAFGKLADYFKSESHDGPIVPNEHMIYSNLERIKGGKFESKLARK